jgi:hypothetical protein
MARKKDPNAMTDHDLLIKINAMLIDILEDRKKVNTALFGEDGTDGMVGWIKTLKTQMVYVFLVGSAIVGALSWLVAAHVKF